MIKAAVFEQEQRFDPWLDPKMKEAFYIISETNKEAFREIFLLSNPVLNKNPFSSNFLNLYLRSERPDAIGTFTLVRKIAVYYFKSLLHFTLYLSKFVFYKLFFQPLSVSKDRELILIDTFFLLRQIKKSGCFFDVYFPGLEEQLKKMHKQYAYLPVFSNYLNNESFFGLFYILRASRRRKTPLLCEFQLLRIPDLFKLFYFVVVYPFCVLRLACSIDVSDYGRYLLRYELLDTISEVTFYNFSRYLQGKRIASLPCPKVKLISWYENLPLHKNLYAGIKKNHNNKAQIYGAQLFLFTESFPYVMPDENERPFGVVPDKILVNGPYYLPPRPLFNYAPGPSLRYARLFQTPVQKREQKNILVLLPYYEQDILNILDLLGKVEQNAWCEKLMIKFHPTIKKAKFINKVPVSSRIVDDDIYKLFQTTQIVIGAASGTPIEAASLGIPVIVVRNPARFEYNNTLPSLGKGIIWEEVEGAEELIRQIQKFKVNLEADAGQIVSIAARYKNMFFSEPLPENITRAFDLSDA